jgi:hypothetical protein
MLKVNRNRLVVITMLLLSVVAFAPLCVSRIGDPLPLVPGAPATALKIDLTTITPTANLQQVSSNTTKILYYRNLTLVVDSTRNLELNITLDEKLNPRIFALSVKPEENLLLTIAISHEPTSGETAVQQALNCYFDLKPNGTKDLQGQMKLNINSSIWEQELNREIVPSQLTWVYWNTTQHQWVSVPSQVDENGYLVCNTTHLSTWTILNTNTSSSESPTPEPSLTPTLTETASPSPEATIEPSSTTIIYVPDLPSMAPFPSHSPAATQPPVTPSPSESQLASPQTETTSNNATSDNQLAIGVSVVVVVAVLTSAIVLKKKGTKKQTTL